ncbi:uncharacterized protein METZ01_LOCUS159922, partial [marine metagenome]
MIFRGLLPVKNLTNGFFVEAPMTIMWSSPA